MCDSRFIGRRGYQRAVDGGQEVRSVSQSGGRSAVGSWAADLRWLAADVFDTGVWRSALAGLGIAVVVLRLGAV